METARSLTPEEEDRCLQFLETMGINDPDHRFLSNRGYFAIFLSNLRPETTGPSINPHVREYREMIRLLSIAGMERLRELLRRNQRKDNPSATPVR